MTVVSAEKARTMDATLPDAETQLIAPMPVLGLEVDAAKVLRDRRRLVALSRGAMGVTITSMILLAGTLVMLVALAIAPSLRRNAATIPCSVGMLVGGLLGVPVAYTLGTVAKVTKRGRRARSLAMTSLVLFMFLVLLFSAIDKAIHR